MRNSVQSEMETLEEAVSALRDNVATLTEILEPLCRKTTGKTTDLPVKKTEGEVSIILLRIRSLQEDISFIDSEINDVLNTLEV